MGVPPRIRTLRSSGDPTPPGPRCGGCIRRGKAGSPWGGRVPLGEGPRRADGDPIAAEGVDSRADRAGVLEPVVFGRGTSAGGRRRHAPAEMAEAQVAEGGRFTLPGAGGLAVIGVDGAWQPSTAIDPARTHGQGASFPRLRGSPRLHAADIVGDRPCGRTVPGTHPSQLPPAPTNGSVARLSHGGATVTGFPQRLSTDAFRSLGESGDAEAHRQRAFDLLRAERGEEDIERCTVPGTRPLRSHLAPSGRTSSSTTRIGAGSADAGSMTPEERSSARTARAGRPRGRCAPRPRPEEAGRTRSPTSTADRGSGYRVAAERVVTDEVLAAEPQRQNTLARQLGRRVPDSGGARKPVKHRPKRLRTRQRSSTRRSRRRLPSEVLRPPSKEAVSRRPSGALDSMGRALRSAMERAGGVVPC